MHKSLIILLTAGALVAGPAAAADGIKVSLVGKTPSQIEADITRAAKTVCSDAVPAPLDAYLTCVRVAVGAAKAQIDAAARPRADKLASTR